MSSDRPPSAIPTLEERLRSRFKGGMIADVSYPDYEMRLAILKTKAQINNWTVEDKMLEQIAAKVQKNIRELEGVLNKVIFFQQYKNTKKKKIIKGVGDFFEISTNDIASRSRKREVAGPRQICMYLLRDVLKLSYPNIGEKLGKRDHTTAIHACDKVAKDISQSAELNQKIMLIKERMYKD